MSRCEDYDETFCPVVKLTTVHTVLTLPSLRVGLCSSYTFFYDTLTDIVYCSQPIGFVDPAHPQLVWRLNKSLYGLKQATRAWYHRFTSYLVSLGFVEARSDTSLFIYHRDGITLYPLLYINDIVLI
jgi:hypothetical protein